MTTEAPHHEILVSPAEPLKLRNLGVVSSLPEKYGVDFMWAGSSSGNGLGGVQRKELRDLVASLPDGRLAKELGQMAGLGFQGLIIEGRGKWTQDGYLVDSYVKFHRKALVGVAMSVEGRGIKVWQTDGLDETWQAVEWMKAWSEKTEHKSLEGRESVKRGSWGKTSNRDFAVHLLTSLPGVGVKTAEAVIDHFGRVPMRWDVGVDELMEVAGVGKMTAKRMVGVLDG